MTKELGMKATIPSPVPPMKLCTNILINPQAPVRIPRGSHGLDMCRVGDLGELFIFNGIVSLGVPSWPLFFSISRLLIACLER